MNKSTIKKIRKKGFGARATLALGVLPACALLIAGCGLFPERRADPTAPGKVPRIVMIAGAPNDNWNAARHGAEAAGKAMGAKIEWHTPVADVPQNQTPLAQQSTWVKDAVKSDPAAIVLAPVDATEMVPPINKAGKKFVPILIFDAPVYTKETLTYLKNDARAAGVLAARAAAKLAGGTGRVAVAKTAEETDERQSADSFKATLQKEFPQIQMGEANGSSAVGVLYAPNEATSRAALKTGSSTTKIIASGAADELVAALKSGRISALVVPDRYEMAYRSVRIVFDYYAQKPPKNEIEIAPVLVTRENLAREESRRVLGVKSNHS